MKTGQRLALGISLGAFLGAALAAGIIHALPVDGNLQSGSAELLIYSLQLAFGHLADNPDRFLIGCGALIGAVTGVLLITPNGPAVARISGRHCFGTPNKSHSSSSHCKVSSDMSDVREAVVMSVAKFPVRRSRK